MGRNRRRRRINLIKLKVNEMDLQALVDGMSERWQKERAATQLTLGDLIDKLELMPLSALITGICSPQSYRGYYVDLAFEKAPEKITVEDALDMCKSAMGEVFTGYKGGDYVMGRNTPIWIAGYGFCGERIMGIDKDSGVIMTAAEDE